MVHEKNFAAVLSEFARTLATDFPIQGILDHLVVRIVDVLPVTAAGVSLITETLAPRYVAASDADALRFERLQTDLREGPCLAAYNSGDPVAVPDLRRDPRFPRFGPPAVAAGLSAVFTFPLRHGQGCLGALELYRDAVGELDEEDMEVAQTLADVTCAYLLNAQARAEATSAANQFRYTALHDPLTGLPNRVLLAQRLEHAALRAQRSQNDAAVLFVDLDRFKAVNDLHGHRVGGELLQAVAHRLKALVRPGDTLVRYSGDEFVFLCEDLHSEGDIELLARRVDAAFSVPFPLGEGLSVTVSASVGVAFAGAGHEISDELVVKADVAMYQAKRNGGAGHQIIDLREATAAHDRQSLEHDLRTAVTEGRLEVAYQPIVRTEDGRVTGVEALLRWTHPQRGPVPAMSIITVAEQSGLIHDIGAWVLERTCRDRRDWLARWPATPLTIAVNVSPRQLTKPDFAATVASVLARTGMDPAALVLEVTENILIEDSDRAMAVLTELKRLGIRLALDDFGTGYSSLSYLRELPIDIVKIDRSFITAIGVTPAGRAIVAAVTNLAHVLGLTITSEGVETQDQHDDIRVIGCESAQGYFYALPMPADAINRLLGGPASLPAAPAGHR